ncbi:BON domain-containing protein [Kineobactrum salinum]|uniref:BON domain-containing protein n=1 Tax=Kineobactrum salinum TaxID=2708301 RepID=A0A6C0U359_9GAMM|nr:BON domain-containing protein [Kineobactrum salinum]QIB66602.1 BON domain-containing protein [Kineobactrum salinum]
MKKLAVPLLLCCSVLASGCGSMLATVEANPIKDDPAKRTMAQRLEDESIEIKSIVNIHAADKRFDEAHLVAVSYNGFVLLAGQVEDAALKTAAAEEVRKIRGVRRIYNELEIGVPTPALVRTSDAWITTKIKAWLLGNVDTPGVRTKVVTENGVVYLMGLVKQEEANRIADVAASVTGVKRVVQLFEIVPT